MKVERGKILELVYASIVTINKMKGDSEPLELKEDARLFGQRSNLSSLSLVTLVIEIEQRLDEELGMIVSLTDEKAMSQSRSPFRDVGLLVDFIHSLQD